MELSIGFLLAIILCGIVLIAMNEKESEKNKNVYNKSSKFLYNSCNSNSYAKARDVFAVLENAGIEPDFLGGRDE